MLNTALIYKILGSLLFLLGTLQAICAGIALGYQEDDVMSFLISTIFTCCCSPVTDASFKSALDSISPNPKPSLLPAMSLISRV